MSTAIPARTREILSRAACDGSALVITEQLAPGEYAACKRVLEAGGAKWNRSKQAHMFSGDAAAGLAAILAGDRVVSAAEADQWFPTPAAVVALLADAARLAPGLEVLEPSAGEGAIAMALARSGCLVDCVEMNAGRAGVLEGNGSAVRLVTCADFLTVPARRAYDRVVMNPPFAKRADVRHVLHALGFIRPGGLLVAVMAASITSRSGRDESRIRELASAITPLPDGSFSESGTGVSAAIVVIPVPGHAAAAASDAEPVRVTFDRTAERAPLFDPATATPGRYVHYDGWRGADAPFRFAGNCIGCSRRTWAHDTGGDDVRGVFGDYTSVPIFAEDLAGIAGDLTIPADLRIPRCSLCWNERERYERCISKALASIRAGASQRRGVVRPVVIPAPAMPAAAAAQAELF